ncbi:MAG TPA: thioesterase family protein [Thermoanaerobaculia bacterium]|nr:thioesterase family protein [Thermoanaerobaculia bacterium]
MIYLLRFVKVAVSTLWRPKLNVLDESVVRLRVWPNDLDLNFHMNNGRYLSMMDLGRLDLFARSGILFPALRRGWMPILGEAKIRFRRSLGPFQIYTLRTRVLAWDEKWFYGEQKFEAKGEVAATALIRGLLRGKEGNILPEEALALGGSVVASPPLPAAFLTW